MANLRISSLLLIAVTAAATSGAASASSYYHSDGTERGVTIHPDHEVSQKTRAQVYEELVYSRINGQLNQPDSAYPSFQLKEKGAGKTRAQVQEELRNMTVEQKRQWHELYGRN